MKVGVIVFPGSNCDRDMHHVLTDVFNLDAEFYWHEKNLPSDIDAVVLPGGFSYGDRLRAGVIAANSPIVMYKEQDEEVYSGATTTHFTKITYPRG